MSVLLDLEKHLAEIMPSNERLEYIAFMGNGAGVVKARGVNNVYVIRHDRSVAIVRNTRVPNAAKLQVVVGYDESNPTLLQVLRTVNAYLDPPYPPVSNHAELMHGAWKYDPVWVTNDQIIPGLVTPVTRYGLLVQLRGFCYYLDGWHLLDNLQVDLSEHIPDTGARWVVADIDVAGEITLRDGDIKASREVLLPEDIPLVLSDKKSLFAVRCYAGQTMIVHLEKKLRDIFDMRFAGVASGGIASSVAWDDVTGKPLVFPPDTDITDPRYPRKWLKSGAPNTTHDSADGYGKSDVWVDQTADAVYICADNADGAALWIQVATGTGGGSGVTCFNVDGRLAVVDNATSPILITADTTISEWRLYLEELGSSGSTIFDVTLVRVGETNASIFDDGITDNRPEIAFDDTDHLIAATPLITDFLAGDVLLLNIEQIAPLASGAVLGAVSSGGGVAFSLTVTDGVTEVNSVSKITFENAVVTDAGAGEVGIFVPPYTPTYYIIPHLLPESTVGFGLVSGGGFGVWLQSSSAQNDQAVWNMALPAGTYTLHITNVSDSNRGFYHLYIDGSEVGSVDGYGTGTNDLTIAGAVVATTGSVEIKIKMSSKNASSSAYYGTIFGLALQRTGD